MNDQVKWMTSNEYNHSIYGAVFLLSHGCELQGNGIPLEFEGRTVGRIHDSMLLPTTASGSIEWTDDVAAEQFRERSLRIGNAKVHIQNYTEVPEGDTLVGINGPASIAERWSVTSVELVPQVVELIS